MNIFITGGTGFIGRALIAKWLNTGHQICVYSRSPSAASALFSTQSAVKFCGDFPDLNGFDVIVNLAGEPIFSCRWTATQKQKLWQSRVNLTSKLTALINQCDQPPSCFISASATGFYGNRNATLLTENSLPSDNFTAKLCQAWEQSASQAHTRVCLLRIGMPFDVSGGALAKMLPLYRLGFGGKLGSGAQFMPWIALSDLVRAIDFLAQNKTCQGAFNLCAPQSISNGEFNQKLGAKLNRLHFASVPAWALKLVLGERACLLLDSQKTKPEKLLQSGFEFEFNQFDDWLAAQRF